MAPRAVPTLNLEDIKCLIIKEDPAVVLVHTYGIFRYETQPKQTSVYWSLFDESVSHDEPLKIRLCGPITDYPRPKTGDIVRIHRLQINQLTHEPEVQHPRNVVVWYGFQHNPVPISCARNPTIKDDDTNRRRQLETHFTLHITQIEQLESRVARGEVYHLAIAGRVKDSEYDSFQHVIIRYSDGTGEYSLRVFKKSLQFEKESNQHFEVASNMRPDEYFVSTFVKHDQERKRFNLSANLDLGRCLRQVERTSILGQKLTETLGENSGIHNHDLAQSASNPPPTGNGSRRSPRFQQPILSQNSQISQGSIGHFQVPQPISPAQALQQNNVALSHRNIPEYTQFSDFPTKDWGFCFYDIAGQVRSTPEIKQYDNCYIQLFDGSQHNLNSSYAQDLGIDCQFGCLVLCVYSKQRPQDIDEHIEKAKSLKEGDLVFIKNVKVSFKAGAKVKMELNANKQHGKSITLVEKSSDFGKFLANRIETPQVEELMQIINSSPSTQESENEPFEL